MWKWDKLPLRQACQARIQSDESLFLPIVRFIASIVETIRGENTRETPVKIHENLLRLLSKKAPIEVPMILPIDQLAFVKRHRFGKGAS